MWTPEDRRGHLEGSLCEPWDPNQHWSNWDAPVFEKVGQLQEGLIRRSPRRARGKARCLGPKLWRTMCSRI